MLESMRVRETVGQVHTHLVSDNTMLLTLSTTPTRTTQNRSSTHHAAPLDRSPSPAGPASVLPLPATPCLSCKSCVCESFLLKNTRSEVLTARGPHQRGPHSHSIGVRLAALLVPRLCFPHRLFHSLAIHRDLPARHTPSPVDCLAPTRPLTSSRPVLLNGQRSSHSQSEVLTNAWRGPQR